ncbi:hypothetical protein ABZV67_02365 [Streptomyces sp. NPDC005065]|uniref:hypothetical protein n=1 Tax=Streptomyces sp. NPDC005065 TaxID=3154461 RepID=UPI0033A60415
MLERPEQVLELAQVSNPRCAGDVPRRVIDQELARHDEGRLSFGQMLQLSHVAPVLRMVISPWNPSGHSPTTR